MPGAFLVYPIVGTPKGIPEGVTPVVEITALKSGRRIAVNLFVTDDKQWVFHPSQFQFRPYLRF
jgi:hypothetical protein